MTATIQRRPALQDASWIVTMVHLSWVAWVWAAATLVYAAILTGIVRWGSIDDSLWQSAAAGWQRWLIFAAGVTTTSSLLRMLVRNGATRGLLSSASTVAMAAIAALGSLWIVAGYAVERVIYDRYGWQQVLNSDSTFDWSDLGRVAVESPIVLATYFLCGWLVGAGFYRYGVIGGVLLIVPSLIPAALIELIASRDFGGVDIDALPRWTDPPELVVTAVAGLALIAATTVVARRATRATPVS